MERAAGFAEAAGTVDFIVRFHFRSDRGNSRLSLKAENAKAIRNICIIVSVIQRCLHNRLRLVFGFLCSILFGGIYDS